MATTLNAFILPSWYPSSANPLSGIFIKEQIEAVADFGPGVCQSVSTWGHQSGHISIRSPLQIARAITWRLVTSGSKHVNYGNRLREFYSPTLSWSHQIPLGGVRSVLTANRNNLLAAIRHHGVVDLIHAHVGYPGGVIAHLLSREFNIPYLLTEHMGPFPHSLVRSGKPIPELQEAFRCAAAVVAVSPFLAEKIRGFGLCQAIVVPNMVDESVFYPGSPCAEKFVFFSLCVLTAGKGIDDLLRAVAHWNPPADLFEFRIAGDGPMAKSYKTLAGQLGISDRIKWIGAVGRKEAANLFRQCHAFVLPSHYETFGVVYAEAIASGKPVIASRCGGPESIVNDINGKLVEVGDIAALSRAMQTMAAECTQYDHEAIRSDFMVRFSRVAVVRQLVDIYKRVARK
jgi:glycosyltransferase involved in cell wall biosynthesis